MRLAIDRAVSIYGVLKITCVGHFEYTGTRLSRYKYYLFTIKLESFFIIKFILVLSSICIL